ncbi:arylcarboxylate reductase [Streptomyces sp. 150FB]|uniref:arylcarboxylate reductase n=1 Tax=Streptomyces sp. 150FB TaxID=1576605 RepID=UPI000589426A|nr:arylcarboxylate reductase [Streptomyces sp. 150FB]KIF76843.1 arylcarboxylate reductase [Streptomyces sp. 150FB]
MTLLVDSEEALTTRWLGTDIDAWTRRVLRRHFDPATGSPYWLARRAELDFDPLEITRYEELTRFGPFSLAELRELAPSELVPSDVPRPLAGRIWESGGTTGAPCRVFYTGAMAEHHSQWRRFGLELAGFEQGRTWLYACPSGPHIVGRGANQIAEMYGSTVYTMDLDPRWIKRLIRNNQLAMMNTYVEHTIEQMTDILETGRIDYLETTPAIMQALINRHPELVAGLSGVGLGGTQLSPQMYREIAGALGDGVIGSTYGNTFGCAAGLPAERGGDVLPYLPNYPQVTMAVVDRDDQERIVEYGETGQVRLTVLHDDLFLPNILERDQAERFDTGARWPSDGVANVRPLQITQAAPEGLY